MNRISKFDTDYELGQDNIRVLGMDVHNPVFAISAGFIVLFIVLATAMPELSLSTLNTLKNASLETFDSFLMVSVSLIFFFCVGLVLSPAGSVKFGGDKATPEFSYPSWIAMLFAAGMGIGLLFWGTAEPMAYYSGWGGTPLGVEPYSDAAFDLAIPTTIYHWGLQAWAVYALVGVALAYFSFNRGLPLTIRSIFYPLLGERVWGWWGHVIDIIAVLATIFGLVTSLGLGASQAASGLDLLFDIPNSSASQILIIAVVTAVAILSVVRGLDGGVKILSNINMVFALLLFLFVLLTGPTAELLKGMWVNTGRYLSELPTLSNWVGRDDESWMQGWSAFYWAWWVSWSPFVGTFIARISKGRTIREFLLAVILIPTIVTILWMTVFGQSALMLARDGIGPLANGITDPTLSTFQLLAELPFSTASSGISIMLILVFFITSADSGSLVVNGITAGGKLESPIRQRVFWAAVIGVIAAVILLMGGSSALSALQAGAVMTGIPFTVILLLIAVSMTKSLCDTKRLQH